VIPKSRRDLEVWQKAMDLVVLGLQSILDKLIDKSN